ncbi:MAG: exopolysaccharide biosynthesis polyprenyl glycosylphosphotransferase [Prevotellaceae bacterium]|nr:exopolysaccharide biosynthesis polyprenyl glycosylphosphotransferase [Prevotellaceae bacterium]
MHYYLETFPLKKRGNRVCKRAFDIVFSLFVLVFIYPWAYLLIGCLIKLRMPGRIIFVQKRTGKEGREFVCYKFRSMCPNRVADIQQAQKDDDRITPLGHFLRTTSLDELPQFWNVLKGEMSVVGPRPHMLLHTEQYRPIIANYDERLLVKPGITGWAQIHGLRGETERVDKMRQRVEYDGWYIRNWSFWLDMKIIFKTVHVMFH